MKKTVLLLAVCLMLGLCACGLRGQSVARNTVAPGGQPADGAGAPLVRRQLLQCVAVPGAQPVPGRLL